MNYMDVIPISKSPEYLIKTFSQELKKALDKGNIVLIYPEEEMWFNYRKPRPLKRGAYQFAYEFNVPIISCFVEMIDTNVDDNDEFYEVIYKIHILKPILPDKNKTMKTNPKILLYILMISTLGINTPLSIVGIISQIKSSCGLPYTILYFIFSYNLHFFLNIWFIKSFSINNYFICFFVKIFI